MRTPLRRFYGRGDLHFITFSCYRRRANLGTRRARDRFLRILDELRSRYGFRLFGYVVMPEHVHLLISEPERGTPSSVLQVLKQRVSRALRRKRPKRAAGRLSLRFISEEAEARAFWPAEILRLQRVEHQEGAGETGIHARESGETEIGDASERLAVE